MEITEKGIIEFCNSQGITLGSLEGGAGGHERTVCAGIVRELLTVCDAVVNDEPCVDLSIPNVSNH